MECMILSAADKTRQDAARECDGRFGSQLHGEPAGGTGMLRTQPNPPSWPEGVPEPEVSWEVRNGDVYTTVSIDGDDVRFWTNSEGDGLSDNAPFFENPWEQKYGDAEYGAMEWAREVHTRIEISLASMTKAISKDPKASAEVIRAATGGIGAPEHRTPESGREFDAELSRLEARIRDARKRLQHGYMVRTISEIKEQCPSVASFYLTSDRHLEVSEILDAEGNDVPSEEWKALYSIFQNRDVDDYTNYLYETVNIRDVLASWG